MDQVYRMIDNHQVCEAVSFVLVNHVPYSRNPIYQDSSIHTKT